MPSVGCFDPHRPYQLSHSLHRTCDIREAAKGSNKSEKRRRLTQNTRGTDGAPSNRLMRWLFTGGLTIAASRIRPWLASRGGGWGQRPSRESAVSPAFRGLSVCHHAMNNPERACTVLPAALRKALFDDPGIYEVAMEAPIVRRKYRKCFGRTR